MTGLREQVVRFVELLRERALRVSVAETIDAIRAVAAAGFERITMREALAAALVKDESDRPIFDQAFAAFFGVGGSTGGQRRKSESRNRSEGAVQGTGSRVESTPSIQEDQSTPRRPQPTQPEREFSPQRLPQATETASKRESLAERGEAEHAETNASEGDVPRPGSDAAHHARSRAAERKPFEQYSQLDYELARVALKPLARRFRVRLGRRLRIAARGRVDFRRTFRAATQRGGAMLDLRFRSRRPRSVDLLILADISGSVRYSTTLMLELAAGARQCLRRTRSLVFVDRLAEADFEQGHLVMAPALDLYARSDFGRVLVELWRGREDLLGRATVLVIMGDGRNNRRPPRADLLREIARLCRAVIWLNPEDRDRWGTGDSAIRLYEREVDALLPARNLRELEAGLLRVAERRTH